MIISIDYPCRFPNYVHTSPRFNGSPQFFLRNQAISGLWWHVFPVGAEILHVLFALHRWSLIPIEIAAMVLVLGADNPGMMK